MIKSENLTIKTLIDNTTCKPTIMAEWGLSVFVDTGDKKILVDTGAGNTDVLLHNMDVSGISVTDIDLLVLSHGHLDHTGGLRPFFERLHSISPNRKLEVICHPAAMSPQYVKNYGSFGCPYTLDELAKLGARFRFITEPYAIDEDTYVSGVIPMTNDFETAGCSFYRQMNNMFVSSSAPVADALLGFDSNGTVFVQDDEVMDDMCLILRTDLGPIVILGCAHRGLINSLHHAMALTNSQSVYMVIGGTHLSGATKERMYQTLKALDEMSVQKIGVSHCTGLTAAAYLHAQLGDKRFFFNNAGSTIQFINGEMQAEKF